MHKVEINWNMVFFASFVIMAAVLVFYALQMNNLMKGSYSIKSYEKKISQLSEVNKNLQVSFAENSLIGQTTQVAKALNFERTTVVKYIQIPVLDNSFAIAK